jgi:cytochrome c-type biogenesis protein CcmF
MLPELAHFALILSLCAAFFQMLAPCVAIAIKISSPATTTKPLNLLPLHKEALWASLTQYFAFAQFFLLLLSFLGLEFALISNDFSVLYVAQNSSSKLPAFYRLAALWGAHEGSVLLWILLLNLWTVAITLMLRKPFSKMLLSQVLGILGLVSFGLLLFLLSTSNPFQRLLPNFPVQGQDLNPLLQDIGLITHPPMLYLGYVGFAIVFAFAMVGMLNQRFDKPWLSAMRGMTALAWSFLTLGITLGSWWAYRELGWGGWWFWDPVENASFLPWLTGAALLHMLILNEKRDVYKGWMVLLAICAFSLSLMGTFLVRSGILTSVHAFANAPGRGIFLFAFLVLVIGASLGLYAWRVPYLHSTPPKHALYSRESLLLINNAIIMTAMATILLGTLYPLILDVLNLGKISIGAPYFNIVFAPLMLILLFVMGFASESRWNQTPTKSLLQTAIILVLLGIIFSVSLSTFAFSWRAWIGIVMASWVIVMTLKSVISAYNRHALSLNLIGMGLAHIGMGVCALGIIVTLALSEERDVRMIPGSTVSMQGYTFNFAGLYDLQGPNFTGIQAHFKVMKHDKIIAVLTAEKRFYSIQKMGFTKAAILPGVWRDLYVALGEPLTGKLDGPWAVRLYYKPFIRWLWVGGFMILVGGLCSGIAGFRHSTHKIYSRQP